MSAAWQCWLCRGYDSERPDERQCRCVTVRHEDWALLLSLWRHTRQPAVGDEPFWPSDEMNDRLDALFFAGEVCRAENPSAHVDLGEESCTS